MSKPETHKLAQFLYERTGATGIVIRTANPASLVGQYENETPLFIISNFLKRGHYKKTLGKQLPNASWLSEKELSEVSLQDKICLYFDSSGSRLKRKEIERSMDESLVTILTVSKKGEKRVRRLAGSLPDNLTVLSGTTKSFDDSPTQDQFSMIGGQLLNVHQKAYPLLKVLAIIPQYNEKDIIGSTLDHLLQQGIDIYIIDNWSTDGSYELVQSAAKKHPGRISYERFPGKKTNTYDWTEILERVTAVAYERKQEYAWVTLNDADELRWSPWEEVTLQKAFSFLDSLGYNCIDYTVFNFKPTEDGFRADDNASDFFQYGEFGDKEAYFVQVKSWKNSQRADLASSGGHHVLFPKLRVFPLKFLLCHYPLRSSEQAARKIFQDRNPRFPASEKKKGWHKHYLGVTKSTAFIHDEKSLTRFSKDKLFTNYLYERLSGIGIKRQ